MSNVRLVPIRRFKGFTDDWVQCKLGDLATITIGEFVIKNKQHPESEYKVYNGGVSYTGFYDEYNNEPDKVVISARGANAGYVNLVKTRYWAGNSCYSVGIISENEFNIDYLYQFLKHTQHLFTDYQQAANIPSISKKDVETFIISGPSFDEQTKIGQFFKTLDDTIVLHQRKLEKLHKSRRAYLIEMFPTFGEKAPHRRFLGFTKDWVQCKLGEELSLLKDGTHGTHVDSDFGPYLLSAKNIKNGRVLISESDRKISEKDYNIIHKNFNLTTGDILLTIVGSIGEAAILEHSDNITFQRSVAYLRPKTMNPLFLYSQILGKNFQRELATRQVVSAQPGIYLGELNEISIVSTCLPEQAKIGQFFKTLDDTIALHQRKLDKLKELKIAYLNDMFV